MKKTIGNALLMMVLVCLSVAAADLTANDVVNDPALLSQNPDLWKNPTLMKSFFDRATPADIQDQISTNPEQAKDYFSEPSHLYGNGGEAFLNEMSGSTFDLNGVDAGSLAWDEKSGTLANFGGSKGTDKQVLQLNSLEKSDTVKPLPDGGFQVTKGGKSTTYDVPGGSLGFEKPDGNTVIPVVRFGEEVFTIQDSYNLQSLSMQKDGDQYTISTFKRENGRIVDGGYIILMRKFPGDNTQRKLTVYGTVSLEEKDGVVSRIKIFDNPLATKESQNSYVGVYNAYIKAVKKETLVYFRESDFKESKEATSLLVRYDKNDGNMKIIRTEGPEGAEAKINRKIMGSYKITTIIDGSVSTSAQDQATAEPKIGLVGLEAINLEKIIQNNFVMKYAKQGTVCAGVVGKMTTLMLKQVMGFDTVEEANSYRISEMGVTGNAWDMRESIIAKGGTTLTVSDCNGEIDCILGKLPPNTPIIAGIYNTGSNYRKTADRLGTYSHVGYLWNDNGNVKLCHDWGSSTGCVDAKEFFTNHKGTYVKEFLIPKYQADAMCCSTLLTACC